MARLQLSLDRAKYQEQIARQYLMIRTNADDQEIQEASRADWGSDGVFH